MSLDSVENRKYFDGVYEDRIWQLYADSYSVRM